MTHINQRRDTAANWTAANPVLDLGEVGWERDTLKCKLGDGIFPWNDLDYAVIDASLYAPLASPALTGSPTAPTQSSGDDSTKLATTAHVKSVTDPINASLADLAPLNNPAFTGEPTAPTPAPGDDSLKLGTTEFIKDAIDTALLGVVAIPVGNVVAFAGSAAPSGWKICDGSTVTRASALGTLLGAMSPAYPYGTGDGSTTCNVPDLRGKVAVGYDSSQTEFDTIGETGGAKAVTLTSAQIPAHTHPVVSGANDNRAAGSSTNISRVGGAGPGTGADGTYNGVTSANTGGGGSHENMPPYVVMNYIIKI